MTKFDILPASGQIIDGIFALPIRVYYEDTDAGGIVYYANYLRFAERARTEYIRALGFVQQKGLEADEKVGFAVRHCEIDYKAPAVLDDALIVTCELTELKGASAAMHQKIYRGDEVLVTLDVKIVCLNLAKKRPVRMPAELAAKMASQN